MKHNTLSLLLIIGISFMFSCSKKEISQIEDSCNGIQLQIGDYPSFPDSKTVGTPDQGKAQWDNGDTLRLIFQTAQDSLAKKYNVVRTAGKWVAETALTLPSDPCRAVVWYAPAYRFGTVDALELKSGFTAGTEEFFKWTSGSDYDITSPDTKLSISFKRDYSRLRIASKDGFTVKMKSEKFVSAGYKTKTLGKSGEIATTADANGNAFFFGTWADATAFSFSSYDKNGDFSFSEYFPSQSASAAGKSYALSCVDDGTYTKIADLVATATKTEASFSVKLKNAVVSYVLGQYAHLEDESGAISAYVNNHGLTAGQRITGSVSGKIKLYNNLPELTSIDYSNATVTSDGIIPCTEMTLDELLNDFDANLNRRILLKDVTITKGTSSGKTSKRTGTISQGTSTIAIYAVYSSSPAVLTAGLTGDLIAYPAYYNTTKQLSIYEASQFTEGGGGEETAFTAIEVMGSYSSTDSESPVAVRSYKDGSDQYSFLKASASMEWHLFNLEDNYYLTVGIPSTSISAGSSVTVTAVTNGTSETSQMTVVKKNSSNAWLEDKTSHKGYIIALQ